MFKVGSWVENEAGVRNEESDQRESPPKNEEKKKDETLRLEEEKSGSRIFLIF
jgi:hypothetical protein